MTCFFYPRTITITRQNRNTTPGAQPYGGLLKSQETTIIAGLAAHIEAETQGRGSPTQLPSDSRGEPIYLIIFKLPLGQVLNRDIITDDLGQRYQVISADWGPMVTTCRSEKLEN